MLAEGWGARGGRLEQIPGAFVPQTTPVLPCLFPVHCRGYQQLLNAMRDAVNAMDAPSLSPPPIPEAQVRGLCGWGVGWGVGGPGTRAMGGCCADAWGDALLQNASPLCPAILPAFCPPGPTCRPPCACPCRSTTFMCPPSWWPSRLGWRKGSPRQVATTSSLGTRAPPRPKTPSSSGPAAATCRQGVACCAGMGSALIAPAIPWPPQLLPLFAGSGVERPADPVP